MIRPSKVNTTSEHNTVKRRTTLCLFVESSSGPHKTYTFAFICGLHAQMDNKDVHRVYVNGRCFVTIPTVCHYYVHEIHLEKLGDTARVQGHTYYFDARLFARSSAGTTYSTRTTS